MNLKKTGFGLLVLAALLAPASAAFAESEILKKFIAAFEENDPFKMTAIIEENKDKMPAEINAVLDGTGLPDALKEDNDSKYFIAELLAKGYLDATGDSGPIKAVKKKAFDSKLPPPVRSVAVNGVHTVNMPKGAGEVKNVFKPEHIIIKKGETVKWTNSDDTPHVFSAIGVISAGGFASKNLEPGQSWEMKFDKPGEYFYLCFIHHAMIGKITVEE